MAKLIIYDNKNILVADLDRTENRSEGRNYTIAKDPGIEPVTKIEIEYAAIFKEYKLIHSISLKKQLKKIEKIVKNKMKLKFINIGNKNANFIKECKHELTYEWLLKQVRPYLLSPNIDFGENKKGNITVFAGMQTVGEIEIIER